MLNKNKVFQTILNQVPDLVCPPLDEREDEFWEADIPSEFAVAKMKEVIQEAVKLLPDDAYWWPHATGWEGSLRLQFNNFSLALRKDLIFSFRKAPHIFSDNEIPTEFYLHWYSVKKPTHLHIKGSLSGLIQNPSPQTIANAFLWLDSEKDNFDATD